MLSYEHNCYVILRDDMSSADSRDACEQLGGALLWLDDVAELEWLQPVLEGYDVNCTHLGCFTCIHSVMTCPTQA